MTIIKSVRRVTRRKRSSAASSNSVDEAPCVSGREETMSVHEEYDDSWYKGNQKLWEQKYKEWEKRDWPPWLANHLCFPFDVKRHDDSDDAYFTDVARRQPFRLGHTMKALALAGEDDLYGVIVKVREGRKVGYVPLCDTEVISRDDKNFWPVREYEVWFANR